MSARYTIIFYLLMNCSCFGGGESIRKSASVFSQPHPRPSATVSIPRHGDNSIRRSIAIYSKLLGFIFFSDDILNGSGLKDLLILRKRKIDFECLPYLTENSDISKSLLKNISAKKRLPTDLSDDYDVEFPLSVDSSKLSTEELLKPRPPRKSTPIAVLQLSEIEFDDEETTAIIFGRWTSREGETANIYFLLPLSYRDIRNGIIATDISEIKLIRIPANCKTN